MNPFQKPDYPPDYYLYHEICLGYGPGKTILCCYADVLLVHCTNKLLTVWVDDEGSLLRCTCTQSLRRFRDAAPYGLFFLYHRAWLINLLRIHKQEKEKMIFTSHISIEGVPILSPSDFDKLNDAVNDFRSRLYRGTAPQE